MAAPMKAEIPPGLDLSSAFVVQFTALSPTDGSVVAGVAVSNVSLLVANVQGGDLGLPAAAGEPEWINVPQEG